MCGPRDFAGVLWMGEGSGRGTGATGGWTGGDTAGAVAGFKRGFRFAFDWWSVQTNSFTIVRLVLTPCRVSNPAMASHEAPFWRSSLMTSLQARRFWKRGRRRG